MTIPNNHTPCYSDDPAERVELTALFDSTDLIDHREAAKLCADCPFVDGCGRLSVELATGPLAWAGLPSGTWAGALWRNGKPATRRTREAVPA